MALHIDLKYANLLSSHFDRFVRKDDYLFNVRCPICGDSQAKKTKMRGYIYQSKQRLAYKCHNCNASLWLGALIKHMNPGLYKEYVLETFKDSPRPSKATTPQNSCTTKIRFGTVDQPIYQHAEKIKDLPQQHYAKKYVKDRLIPEKFWHKLYFTERYKDFCDEVAPGHDKELRNDARLVIPFYDAHGDVIAVSGRAFDDDGIRYITIRTTKDTNKIVYGLDRVDQSKPVFIVEGPLDSLFLSNAVASGDSNLILTAKQLSAAQVVLVFDNEPRNKENIRLIEKAVEEGYSVVIWPEWLHEKDINAMVLAKYDPSAIETIIHTSIHSGLTALTHLSFWKKTPTRKGVLV
jgi:hypothetical protein